jgi:hypothetical protein
LFFSSDCRYPLLARAATPAQVDRMVTRFLANASELAVNAAQKFGMPSISRSSSAFGDNSYWRGRAWGPMNMLVWLSLREYVAVVVIAVVVVVVAVAVIFVVVVVVGGGGR